jgi:hypothetical protein
MKISSLFLALSLVANIALAALIIRPPTDSKSTSSRSLSDSRSAAAKAAAAAEASKSALAGSVTETKSWARLKTDDLSVLVTRLRAAGFPPTLIRRIIGSLVSERFDARRLEIEKPRLEAPFWTNTPNSYSDPKIGPELMKLNREQTELLKKVLGGNLNDLFADNEENKAMLRLQIGDVPPEKLDHLYTVMMDYGEKRMKVYSPASNGGTLISTDLEKAASIEKEMRTELATFLTPAELSDFMLHNSETSGRLRYMLMPIQPTEAEYRTIFPIYQTFQDQFPPTVGIPPPEQPAARKAAQDQMNTQISALLGPERAADFQQATNPAYGQLNRLVSRLELPISAATQVAAVQTDIQQRADAVRNDNSLSSADRNAQLNTLAQEASTKVGAALGSARGVEAYKQYGGQWLQNLAPKPKG